jgi:hypothetical protein
MMRFAVTNCAVWGLKSGPSTRSTVFKVRYIRYCSPFVEIEPAFKLNKAILC